MSNYDLSLPSSSNEDHHSPLSASARKPRGRPPGSKNKPKPPLILTRESNSSLRPIILSLAAGTDILDSLAAFARRRRLGLSILAASGPISSLSLRQPATSFAAFTVSGRFDILSLSGTIHPPLSPSPPAAGFTISVAGARGEVVGGAVAGPVTAAGTVVIVAGCFLTAEILRLPEEDGRSEEVVVAGKELSGQVGNDVVLWATPASSRSFSASHLRPPQY